MSAEEQPSEVTRALGDVKRGVPGSDEVLWSLIYADLHAFAHRRLRAEGPDPLLETTALVHEAYLRLVAPQSRIDWRDRAHFFAVAARVIRRILVDWARSADRAKRGGGRAERVALTDTIAISGQQTLDVLALDEALARLAAQDRRSSQVVELRFFAGLGIDEVAALLKVTSRTVDGHWQFARSWLRRELTRGT